MQMNWEIRAGGGRIQAVVRDGQGGMVRQSDDALSAAEVARRLGKSRRHIYRYVIGKQLTPMGKFLNEWLFDAGEVERFRYAQTMGRVTLRRFAIPANLGAFFPEYQLSQMNPWTNAPAVISRILDSGTRREWRWVFRRYPRSLICAVVRDHGARLMSERSNHFWSWLLNAQAAHSRSGARPARSGI